MYLFVAFFFSSDKVSKLSKIISDSVLWCVLQVFVVFLSNGVHVIFNYITENLA